MSNAVMVFETIPRTEDAIPYIDRAVEIIREAGVQYEVGPLDTMIEGDLDLLLDLVKKVHVELAAIGGNTSISSNIKIHYDPQGISSEKLTERYR